MQRNKAVYICTRLAGISKDAVVKGSSLSVGIAARVGWFSFFFNAEKKLQNKFAGCLKSVVYLQPLWNEGEVHKGV